MDIKIHCDMRVVERLNEGAIRYVESNLSFQPFQHRFYVGRTGRDTTYAKASNRF